MGDRLKPVRNALLVVVAAISLLPLGLLIPGVPAIFGQAASILPSGLAAEISYGLVSGARWNVGSLINVVLLGAWFVALLGLGVKMSRRNFLEVLQIDDQSSDDGL